MQPCDKSKWLFLLLIQVSHTYDNTDGWTYGRVVRSAPGQSQQHHPHRHHRGEAGVGGARTTRVKRNTATTPHSGNRGASAASYNNTDGVHDIVSDFGTGLNQNFNSPVTDKVVSRVQP